LGFFREGHCPKKVTEMALILLFLGLLLDFLHCELGIIWDYLRVTFKYGITNKGMEYETQLVRNFLSIFVFNHERSVLVLWLFYAIHRT
jgi:hypothetical protein